MLQGDVVLGLGQHRADAEADTASRGQSALHGLCVPGGTSDAMDAERTSCSAGCIGPRSKRYAQSTGSARQSEHKLGKQEGHCGTAEKNKNVAA